MKKLIAVLITTLFSIGAFAAPSVVMDFEILLSETAEQSVVHGTQYVEDGFRLSASCCEPFGTPQETDLRTAGSLTAIFAGSTAMRGGKTNTLITLERTDGAAFTLDSIEIATLPNTERINDVLVPINTGLPTVVAFEGMKEDGTTVSQTISHSDFLTLTAYAFDGFTDLTAVRWFQGTGAPSAHQFDNIRARPMPRLVSIDIKPGDDENCHDRRHGIVSVAILGNPTFDVTNINVHSLRLDSDLRVRSDQVYCSIDYMNDDDFFDLKCKFGDSVSRVWLLGDEDGTVTGELYDGTEFQGTDAICVIPKRKPQW